MPRKKTSYRRKGKAQMSAAQVARIAKQAVMKTAETKMFPAENQNLAIGADDACALFKDLDNPAQGDDNEQRIGDTITSTGIQVKYTLGAITESRDYFVRCVLFMARQDELDVITNQFLTSTANEPLTPIANNIQDIARSLNRKQMDRVLFDKVHHIGRYSGSANRSFLFQQKFIKLKDKRSWTHDTNDETENHNLRFLVIVRDSQGATVGVGQDVQCTLYTRYYYKDI